MFGNAIDDGRAIKCPFCGEFPRLEEFDDNFWSRKMKTRGWRFTDYVSHCCPNHERMLAKGKPTEIYAHFNGGISENLWDSGELLKAREEAEGNAIRKWNALVSELSNAANGECNEKHD